MRTVDFTPLYRSIVGFDRLADMMDSATKIESQGYPPYNIQHVADTTVYGDVMTVSFNQDTTLDLEAGSVDTVLTFRNIHNWMSRGFAERAFADFHTVLRPGGVLGVVEHRLPSTREQDPSLTEIEFPSD